MSGANVVASGSSAGSLAGNYDFRAKMNQEEIDDLRNNRLYAAKDLDDLKERISQMESSQVLRILVPSLGNSLYEQGLGTSPENKATRIRRFLSRLRRMVDGKRAIALVTIPKLLFPDDAAVKSFECFADASVQLSSFTLSKEEHGFGDAHGILTVRKLVQLNSLACQYPDTLNYLYTISKKGLDIEKMSLPPEETRTGDGSHSHQAIKGNANLDF
jgi:archaellum biogenesis ATPase FlaH